MAFGRETTDIMERQYPSVCFPDLTEMIKCGTVQGTRPESEGVTGYSYEHCFLHSHQIVWTFAGITKDSFFAL